MEENLIFRNDFRTDLNEEGLKVMIEILPWTFNLASTKLSGILSLKKRLGRLCILLSGKYERLNQSLSFWYYILMLVGNILVFR